MADVRISLSPTPPFFSFTPLLSATSISFTSQTVHLSVRTVVFCTWLLLSQFVGESYFLSNLPACEWDTLNISCPSTLDFNVFTVLTISRPYCTVGMHGYENNYQLMAWYAKNWNNSIKASESAINAGRFYTNHYAISVSCNYCLESKYIHLY